MHNTVTHNSEEFPDELAPGALLLLGQYKIESYLIRGGFGITYLARDSLDRRVVIKECFPNTICCRVDGKVMAKRQDQQDQFSSILRHFLREARRLARLTHPNIVGVHQVFEENGTAYMALDHVDGMDLMSVVEDEPHRLTTTMIRSMLVTSLEAISYIHDKGILHRDISPDNFLLDQDNTLTLIDFGAAREEVTGKTRALSTLLAVKDGYSPQELYLRDVKEFPSSDLYALGATFYHLITGEAPPNSQLRLAQIAADAQDPFEPLTTRIKGYDAEFLDAINKSLEVFPEDRIQSAQEWLEAIDPERRRKAALARASKDFSIREKISQLVVETNRNLRASTASSDNLPRNGAKIRQTSKPARIATAPEEKTVSKPVDIFGEPIEDVEAWLKAQDRILERQKAREEELRRRAEAKEKAKQKPEPVTPFRPVPHSSHNSVSGNDPQPADRPTAKPAQKPKPEQLWIPNPMAKSPNRATPVRPERPAFFRALAERFTGTPLFPPKKAVKPDTKKEFP